MNKYLKLIFLLFIISNSLFSQNSLVISNGKRTKKLQTNNKYDFLEVTTFNKIGEDIDSTTTVTGYFHELNNEKLRIFPVIYNIDIKASDTTFTFKSINCGAQEFVELDINSIKTIRYQDEGAANRYNIGAFCYFAGSLTSLLIAPLISINYSKGTFNEQRYFKTAAIGAGLVVIGIPLDILGHRKKYHFMPKNEKRPKKLWKIVR